LANHCAYERLVDPKNLTLCPTVLLPTVTVPVIPTLPTTVDAPVTVSAPVSEVAPVCVSPPFATTADCTSSLSAE